MSIAVSYQSLRQSVPAHVAIVLAAKTRTADEVREAIAAGATDIGYNYVQEAMSMRDQLGPEASKVRWHLIGHLQSNKAGKALQVFDTVQTVDSVSLAEALSKRCVAAGRTLPVLIEVNAAFEQSKSGIAPELDSLLPLARHIASAPALTLEGLMTMGAADRTAEQLRPDFRRVRELLEAMRAELPHAPLHTLSMGMSESYLVAVEEGATTVRIGSLVFGAR